MRADFLTLRAEVATQARTALPPDGLLAVLDHVRTSRESSRAELARATGLGRSVLTQRVEALLEYGLIAEDREKTVGRQNGSRLGGHFRSECKDICTTRQDFS